MVFQLSNNVNKNKIFLVNKSDIQGRIEPEFYRPSMYQLERKIRAKSDKRLKDYAQSFFGGATPSKKESEKYYSDSTHGVPFLRVQNLQTTGELSLDKCAYITYETHNSLLKRSQVSEGDLLIKITGVGRMAVAAVAPKGFVGNTNQHMVVVRTGDVDISRYLAYYLNLDIIEKIASRYSTGGTRPALDYPSLKNLPIIDGLDFSFVGNAIKVKKAKEAEAKRLLDSINEYLVAELGISMPKDDTTLDNRIFISNFMKIEGNRIDPMFSLYLGKNMLSQCYDNINLQSIANIDKGDALTSAEIENGNIPVIAGGQTSPYCHNCYNFEGNVITVSASGAYAGYLWYHNYPIYATDCCVIASKDESRFMTKYLFEVLKLQQNAIYRLQTGSAQPHVYATDMQRLSVPDIPIEKQQEIVDNIRNIRDKANALLEEGRRILENAKNEVEMKIIG